MQYSAGQCSTEQYSAVQCSAVQFNVVQCSAVQCSTVQCSAVQCSVVVQCSGAPYRPAFSGPRQRTNVSRALGHPPRLHCTAQCTALHSAVQCGTVGLIQHAGGGSRPPDYIYILMVWGRKPLPQPSADRLLSRPNSPEHLQFQLCSVLSTL